MQLQKKRQPQEVVERVPEIQPAIIEPLEFDGSQILNAPVMMPINASNNVSDLHISTALEIPPMVEEAPPREEVKAQPVYYPVANFDQVPAFPSLDLAEPAVQEKPQLQGYPQMPILQQPPAQAYVAPQEQVYAQPVLYPGLSEEKP